MSRPIVTWLWAVDAGGRSIGDAVRLDRSVEDADVSGLFDQFWAAARVEAWRHGRRVDVWWRTPRLEAAIKMERDEREG